MGYRIIWSDKAVADLAEIRRHYVNTRGENTAVLVIKDIYSHIDKLRELPSRGTRLDESTRVLHHPPYLIHYRADNERQLVYVRRIRDGRRV